MVTDQNFIRLVSNRKRSDEISGIFKMSVGSWLKAPDKNRILFAAEKKKAKPKVLEGVAWFKFFCDRGTVFLF